jgi:hypothetical protein
MGLSGMRAHYYDFAPYSNPSTWLGPDASGSIPTVSAVSPDEATQPGPEGANEALTIPAVAAISQFLSGSLELLEVWLGGLDSNQDNQIQNLMYCQLYDLPADGRQQKRPQARPANTLLAERTFVNGRKGCPAAYSPSLGYSVAMQLTTTKFPDASDRAIGIGLNRSDAHEALEPGLEVVRQTMETLSDKAKEILGEISNADNPLASQGKVLIRIERVCDEALLRKGQLKLLDCDKRKIFALFAALGYVDSKLAREIRNVIMEALSRGGVPFRFDGELKVGGSLQIYIFD